MRIPAHHRTMALVGVILVSACAGRRESGSQADPNLITRTEIEATTASDLYGVIRQLRPRWLTVRGARTLDARSGIVVFQDRNFLGSVDVLRDMPRGVAQSLRYLDGPRAFATLPGLGPNVEAAIVIEPARGR